MICPYIKIIIAINNYFEILGVGPNLHFFNGTFKVEVRVNDNPHVTWKIYY